MTLQPAGVLRRYAAWSLDFTGLAALAGLLAHARMRAGAEEATAALARLSASLARYAGDAVEQSEPPTRLAARLLADPLLQAAADAVQAGIVHMLLPWLLAYAGLAAVYHVAFEHSQWQASPGKRALHLVVVDATGDRRPALRQTLVRHFAGALSWLTLNLGHALAAMPPQKRALHDYMAGTRVMCLDAKPNLPAWAGAWLALQAVASVALLAGGFARCMAFVQHASVQ